MKNFFKMLCAFIFIMMVAVVSGMAHVIGVPITPDKQTLLESVMNFLIENWVWLLPGLTWLLHRFIPTEKADRIISIVKWIFDKIVPDRKKGGGKH